MELAATEVFAAGTCGRAAQHLHRSTIKTAEMESVAPGKRRGGINHLDNH